MKLPAHLRRELARRSRNAERQKVVLALLLQPPACFGRKRRGGSRGAPLLAIGGQKPRGGRLT